MTWWRDGVLYQIYPRSFQDSNGDGVGDLEGIRSRLDHLRWLGGDGIWLSPVYPSPGTDYGYDVADYCDIDPLFGSLETFDRLVDEAHARDIRVVMDLVPSHTSDVHPWFTQSRASTHNAKRDWYIWRDPAPDGGPPNNWLSAFRGEPAWTLDETTGQYYLHSFLPTQPDLNWHNPEVADAMDDVLRFWLDRGVDGFRIDVIYRLVKDALLRDNPSPTERVYNIDQPEVHDICRRFRRVLDAYPDRMAVGEVTIIDPKAVASYYGADCDELHLAFNFHFAYRDWDATDFAHAIDAAHAALPEGAWPCWVLSNHDVLRHPMRFGPQRARAAAVFLLTLRGTPFLYQGEEIGMTGCDIPPERVVDVAGRDPARTPVQWDGGPNAGFCPPGVEPWLPVCPDGVNVAAQREDPASLLHLYRDLLALRRRTPALHRGTYERLPAPEGVLAYERSCDGSVARVAVNFTPRAETIDIGMPVALATHDGVTPTRLPADAAAVYLP